MPTLVIKSFPEPLHAKLRQIAELHRRSVTQETIHWIELGSVEVQALAGFADQIVCSCLGRAEFYSIGFRKVRKVREGQATNATTRQV
jgi:uncharacterized protein (DUF427 family)